MLYNWFVKYKLEKSNGLKVRRKGCLSNMKKQVYVNNEQCYVNKNKGLTLEIILDIFCYALILMMASTIFNNIYIENVWYALIASTIIGVLNLTIKPFLIYITLPLTILTLGIFYPVVNIVVLKLASLFLGSHFIVDGWFTPFFVSLFISIMKIIFEIFIIKPIVER